MDIQAILKTVDHTLLRPEATWPQIKALCDEGVRYGVATVCVPPAHVANAAQYLNGNLPVCTVIGFPNGYSTTYMKCLEAQDARQNGEIIINAQDGRGYYRSEEPKDLAGQYVRNRNRAMAILVQQKYIRRKLKAAGWEFVKGRNPVQGNTVVWPDSSKQAKQ